VFWRYGSYLQCASAALKHAFATIGPVICRSSVSVKDPASIFTVAGDLIGHMLNAAAITSGICRNQWSTLKASAVARDSSLQGILPRLRSVLAWAAPIRTSGVTIVCGRQRAGTDVVCDVAEAAHENA
jgi:hypothetical protein